MLARLIIPMNCAFQKDDGGMRGEREKPVTAEHKLMFLFNMFYPDLGVLRQRALGFHKALHELGRAPLDCRGADAAGCQKQQHNPGLHACCV